MSCDVWHLRIFQFCHINITACLCAAARGAFCQTVLPHIIIVRWLRRKCHIPANGWHLCEGLLFGKGGDSGYIFRERRGGHGLGLACIDHVQRNGTAGDERINIAEGTAPAVCCTAAAVEGPFWALEGGVWILADRVDADKLLSDVSVRWTGRGHCAKKDFWGKKRRKNKLFVNLTRLYAFFTDLGCVEKRVWFLCILHIAFGVLTVAACRSENRKFAQER